MPQEIETSSCRALQIAFDRLDLPTPPTLLPILWSLILFFLPSTSRVLLQQVTPR